MKKFGHTATWSSERMRVLQTLSALMLVVVLEALLRGEGIELPRKPGSSLFSIISDDTRMVLSTAMMGKVDSYFHGGAKVGNCPVVNQQKTPGENQLPDEHDQTCSEHCEHAENPRHGFSPVKWINARIHVQEHRHLEKERSVEMLPWIMAACRAAPHNIESYQVGSYILNAMTDKPGIAIDFLKDGIKKNPDNPDLELSLAEIYFNTLSDSANAAIHFESAMQKSLAKKGELSDEDRWLRLKLCFYIGRIAKDKGDLLRLQEVLKQAQAINSGSVMTKALANWLAELNSPEREATE